MSVEKGSLSHLAKPGGEISVRVTPKASRNAVEIENGSVRVYVTTVPENGKANRDVLKLLARALGVAKSRVVLTRGATSREKHFRIR